jgi:putative peptidoglycan lipid II flippase
VDGRWASAAGEQSVAWMGYATTLIQLPLGLVPVAVSLAALPSLSQFAAEQDWDGFREVFGRGFRLVVVLLIPATVGLSVLAGPVIRLLFEHGNFTPNDTLMTSRALRFYLIGLPFAGIDFLLNYTFYARQNTRAPATVGVISVGFYFVTALLLKGGPLGFLGLVLADSVKQAAHAVIMTVLLLRSVGRLNRQHVLRTIGLSAVAAGLMAVVLYLLSEAIGDIAPKSIIGAFLVVAVAGGLGGALYLAIMHWMRVEEVSRLVDGVTGRFLRRR